jgi:hypothetical protein
VTYVAPSVEQFARKRLRLGFELRTPVAEGLQRQALRLAILPLIQVTTLPRFVMRPPERLAVSRPPFSLRRHVDLLVAKTSTRRDRNQPV